MAQVLIEFIGKFCTHLVFQALTCATHLKRYNNIRIFSLEKRTERQQSDGANNKQEFS